MKKMRAFLLVTILFCMAVAFAACASPEDRREANRYAREHKKDFKQAVENAMGPNYSLSDVKGKLVPYGSVMTIGYSAEHALTGKVTDKTTKKTYKATYDFDQDILYTDAFVDEVFDDLIDKLKIDKLKIIYKNSYEPTNYQYQFPAYVHTIEDALNERRDIFYYIVTSEDLESYDFNEYMDLCTKIHYCNMVHIFSSDDFQNMETFQKEYSRIVIGEERGTVNYNGRDTDIIQVFNLKKYVLIGKKNHQMYFNRYSKDGLEYTSY